MAKKVIGNLKLRIPGGKATAGPPVGSTLGQWGLNMMDFINPFNEKTKEYNGKNVIVHIQVFEDRTFAWTCLGQPVDDLIREELKLQKGSGRPNTEKVGKITREQLEKIANIKMEQLNAIDLESMTKEDIKAEEMTVSETPEVAETPKTAEKFAKAGKKSKKHVEEVKAEEERKARAAENKLAELEVKPKGEKPVTRSVLERRGKKYQAAYKDIDHAKFYTLSEAIALAVKTNPAKFAATVEIHARLGVDPRQADQNIRTTLVLPHGNGKEVRVAVFAPEDECKKAKAAGADIAEDVEFIKQLEKGIINFDILISTPTYMPKLGKFARLLGPKGLMPNPKAGTVTTDIEKAVKESKAGKIEYRVDKQAIVHLGLGKTNFTEAKLLENATAFLDSLKSMKPASLKGQYIKSIYISSTMGPSIAIENIYN